MIQACSLPTGSETELLISRLLPAPRELVFRAWTDPIHLGRWWGHRNFTTTVLELDLRVGGALRLEMRAPDGTVYGCHGTYREIVPPKRLVLTGPPECDHACGAGIPPRSTVIITFEERGSETLLSLLTRFASLEDLQAAAASGYELGWTETFAHLDELLADSANLPRA